VPTRRSRRLNLTGGANLNVPMGKNGLLRRQHQRAASRANRSTAFLNGLPQPSPVSEQDFWNGALSLSWSL